MTKATEAERKAISAGYAAAQYAASRLGWHGMRDFDVAAKLRLSGSQLSPIDRKGMVLRAFLNGYDAPDMKACDMHAMDQGAILLNVLGAAIATRVYGEDDTLADTLARQIDVARAGVDAWQAAWERG